MLGFQTDWDIECLVFDWTQIGVVLGLGFIAKQRSGFGWGGGGGGVGGYAFFHRIFFDDNVFSFLFLLFSDFTR